MASTPADLITLSRLLDEALDLAPAQLDAWLDALPADQAHLRPQLREMLDAHLAQSHPDFLAEGPRLPGAVDDTVASTGDLIGPYRLIREIGRGGMGAVWLAERADGSYKRQVALKLPRLAWGAGLAERMAREREIGMLLEHPNIARLYDAGVDARGRPYLALEYIDGQPLDVWCEAQKLPIRERLQLFVQVARAVAYAHGRLVVHRDLKPSNVLVTADGQIHLLDFGIAKLLNEAAGDGRLTKEHGRVLTPHYASPEQIRGEVVTVASDVYSLGALLYELLTGHYPHGKGKLSLAAIEAATLADELVPASARAPTRQQAKVLRGEIDAILAKALKADPAKRYTTADALALDIDHYLNGERVAAQPDGWSYRLTKRVRQHRIAVAGVVAVVLVTTIGSILVATQTIKAARSADRERVVKQFVADVLRASITGSKSSAQSVSGYEDEVAKGLRLVQQRFSDSPELQAELCGILGRVYSSMGAFEHAAAYLRAQFDLLERLGAPLEHRSETLRLVAESEMRAANLPGAFGHVRTAIALAGENHPLLVAALTTNLQVAIWDGTQSTIKESLDRLEHSLSQQGEESIAQAWMIAGRGYWLAGENEFDKTPGLVDQAIGIALRVEGGLSQTALELRLGLGDHFGRRGFKDKAKPYYDAAFKALEDLGGPSLLRAAAIRAYSWQYLTTERADYERASEIIKNCQAVLDNSSFPVPPILRAEVDFQRARLELSYGNVAEGTQWLNRSAEIMLTSFRSSARELHQIYHLIATQRMASGRHEEAITSILKKAEARSDMGEATTPFGAYAFVQMATNFYMMGRFDEAEAVLDFAPMFQPNIGAKNPEAHRIALTWTRARIKLERGDLDAARTILQARPKDEVGFDGIVVGTLPDELNCLAKETAIVGLRKLEIAVEADSKWWYKNSPYTAWLRSLVGNCALSAGQRSKALGYAKQARAAFEEQPEVSPFFKAPLAKLEARLAGARSP